MLKLKLQYFGHLMLREKTLMLGKIERNGHEFVQTPGDSEGQRSLLCCTPWGRRERDIT